MTGTGTALDPYIIMTRADLAAVNDHLDAYYELGADINLSSGGGWTSLGTFMGHFDGKNHTISGMVISTHNSDYAGLFSQAGACTIQDVTLSNCSISITGSGTNVSHYVGILVGKIAPAADTAATISGCSVIASTITNTTTAFYVGLLIGYISRGVTCSSCTTSGILVSSGGGQFWGGFIGFATTTTAQGGSTISDCTAVVTIEDNSTANLLEVAGFVGGTLPNAGTIAFSGDSGTLTIHGTSGYVVDAAGFAAYVNGKIAFANCGGKICATGTIGNVGGFAVNSYRYGNVTPTYTDCVATGSIVGDGITSYCGGFLSHQQGIFIRCKALTDVDVGAMETGGFVGYAHNYATFTDCYVLGNIISSYSPGVDIGGFAGYAEDADTAFTNCYSVGKVTATGSTPYSGGFCGAASSVSATSCYWDTQTSEQSTSALGTGKTTSQMQAQSTFTNWNFTTIWNIASGMYPFLRTAFVTLTKCGAETVVSVVHSLVWPFKFCLTHKKV